MTILDSKPLTMSEVVSLAGDSDREKNVKEFIRRFNKMSVEKAVEMKQELEALDLIKLKDKHIVKIVDFMPVDAMDLNKILEDVSLDQEAVTKILDVVKKY
jgi:DNA-directed RNA polymerase subunit F